MLLEMALIQTPKIKVFASYEPAKFFYMPPARLGLRRQSPPGAYVCGTQTDGKCVGIGVPQSLNQMPGLNGGITKFHPTVPGYIQRRWAVSSNQPLTVFSDEDPKKNVVLFPPHRSTHSDLPFGNGGTNTGWFEENDPTGPPLHKCSSLGKGKAIHAAGDHIGLREILKFLAVELTSQPRDPRISVFPWLPPFG
jgi:hypothetical protein